MAISDTLGGKKIHKKLGLSFSYISQKSNCYLLISDHTNVWTMVTFCAFFFLIFLGNQSPILPYEQYSLTHLSSNLVLVYRCHQPWWCQTELKSAWVITKVIDCLTRLYAPLSTENYLSFIRWLKPSVPSRVAHSSLFLFFLNTRLCMCICKYAWAGGVGLWRPLLCSFHLLKKRFSPCFSNNQ